MRIRVSFPLACVAFLASPLQAQFINRAVWLGDEQESFRRDFGQDAEYFLNRAVSVDLPPWWIPDERDPFRDRLSAAGGSVTSRELTVEALANVGVPMGDGFIGRFNYLQSENQTDQFERFALGVETSVSESTAFFGQLEGRADKSRADITFGVELFRGEHSAQRLSLTLVDFARGKSDEFNYERDPYGLLFAGFLGDPEGHDLVYELGLQLPLEERDLGSGDLLRLQRTIGSVEARTRLGARDRLILGLEGELTSKNLVPDDPSATTAEDADIDRLRVRTEWWHRGAHEREYALGAYYLHLDEDYERPDDPAGSASARRREWMLYTRTHLPLSGAWSLEPYIIGGRVELTNLGPALEPVGLDKTGFEGRYGLPLRYLFSERAWMRFDLAMQLDRFAFGGASVQWVASF